MDNKNIIFAIDDLIYDKNVKEESENENALTLYENNENDLVINKYFKYNFLNEFSSDIKNFYSKEERNINESTTLNYYYYNTSNYNNNNNDIEEKKNKNKRITKDSTNFNTICKDENENIDNDCALSMNPNDPNNFENSLIFLNNENQEDFY
jgi:hypothetical protein